MKNVDLSVFVANVLSVIGLFCTFLGAGWCIMSIVESGFSENSVLWLTLGIFMSGLFTLGFGVLIKLVGEIAGKYKAD